MRNKAESENDELIWSLLAAKYNREAALRQFMRIVLQLLFELTNYVSPSRYLRIAERRPFRCK